MAERINDLIDHIYEGGASKLAIEDMRAMPDDLRHRIRDELEKDPRQSWDEALWVIAGLDLDDDAEENE